MAQELKTPASKHEGPSLIFRTHTKKGELILQVSLWPPCVLHVPTINKCVF